MSARGAGALRRFVRLEGGRYAEAEGDAGRLLSAAPWLGGVPTGESVPLEGARLLAPVEPSKILGVGRNYRAHAAELGNEVPAEPLLFLKPPSSIVGPGGEVELPPREVSARVDHEAELAVVIGRRCRRVSADEARAHVFGLTAACDVTARDLQKKDGQWTRAKGMDGFCPVGPAVVSGLDPSALGIRGRVSGRLAQDGTTADMTRGVFDLVAYASRFFTLEPGDLLLTGTPSGVGPLEAGDLLEIEIDEIGTLSVRVVASSEAGP